MKFLKRTLPVALAIMICISAFGLPVSATNVTQLGAYGKNGVVREPTTAVDLYDFPNFPLVTSSMGDRYMVASVAVQKFLMLFGDSMAKRLMPAGGADGFFGSTSAAVTADFQARTGLKSDGKVGGKTWYKMGSLMEKAYNPSVGGTIYLHFNRSYYHQLDDERVIVHVQQGYQAVNHKNKISDYCFYTP